MVFQRPVMLRRSALANILYALPVAGGPPRRARRARRKRSNGGLEATGGSARARVLSGGEQQRPAQRAPGR